MNEIEKRDIRKMLIAIFINQFSTALIYIISSLDDETVLISEDKLSDSSNHNDDNDNFVDSSKSHFSLILAEFVSTER